MGLSLAEAKILLEKAGYRVEREEQTLKDLSQAHNVPPQKIYQIMLPAAQKSSIYSGESKALPESPVPGTGNLTLADFCSQYNLNMKAVLRSLSEMNIDAREDQTIKKIAELNKTSAIHVYEKIKTAVKNTSVNE